MQNIVRENILPFTGAKRETLVETFQHTLQEAFESNPDAMLTLAFLYHSRLSTNTENTKYWLNAAIDKIPEKERTTLQNSIINMISKSL